MAMWKLTHFSSMETEIIFEITNLHQSKADKGAYDLGLVWVQLGNPFMYTFESQPFQS